jgi:hypothetical protein
MGTQDILRFVEVNLIWFTNMLHGQTIYFLHWIPLYVSHGRIFVQVTGCRLLTAEGLV